MLIVRENLVQQIIKLFRDGYADDLGLIIMPVNMDVNECLDHRIIGFDFQVNCSDANTQGSTYTNSTRNIVSTNVVILDSHQSDICG